MIKLHLNIAYNTGLNTKSKSEHTLYSITKVLICLQTLKCPLVLGKLLGMTNHLVKYVNLKINSFQENEQKPF